MAEGLLVLAIIGAVTTLKLSGIVNGWVTVAVAIILGIVAGIGQVEGLNVITGLLSGLAALGTATVADRIAKS
jgi:hypothetical protein